MVRPRLVVAVVLAAVTLAAAGCAKPAKKDGPAASASPTVVASSAASSASPSPTAYPPAGWKLCQNPMRGTSMAYPNTWYTTSLSPSDACSLFDPMTFTILPGSEGPIVALNAHMVTDTLDHYVTSLTDPMYTVTISRTDTTVLGMRAVKFETQARPDSPLFAGVKRYGYAIDRGTRTFVLYAAAQATEARYTEWKGVCDTAVGTLRFDH
jgi:hypothetical protein